MDSLKVGLYMYVSRRANFMRNSWDTELKLCVVCTADSTTVLCDNPMRPSMIQVFSDSRKGSSTLIFQCFLSWDTFGLGYDYSHIINNDYSDMPLLRFSWSRTATWAWEQKMRHSGYYKGWKEVFLSLHRATPGAARNNTEETYYTELFINLFLLYKNSIVTLRSTKKYNFYSYSIFYSSL